MVGAPCCSVSTGAQVGGDYCKGGLAAQPSFKHSSVALVGAHSVCCEQFVLLLLLLPLLLMLNYIWAGLIIISLVFAVSTDVHELSTDRYRNAEAFEVTLTFPNTYDADARRQAVTVHLDTTSFAAFYPGEGTPAPRYEGQLVQTQDGNQVVFGSGMALPQPWQDMRDFYGDDTSDPIRAEARLLDAPTAATHAALTFEPVHFRKLNDIAGAALDFAETAASLALGLIGVLALMLGLLKIGEKGGLIHTLTRFVQPVLRPLFPDLPKDHPALGTISLNMLANMFGLGNAATPLGIKAMEQLQEENPEKETATNSMVMLLALNTSSVQLVPPVLLVAIMGLQVNELVFSITIATALTTVAGIAGAIFFSRMKRFSDTDPMKNAS